MTILLRQNDDQPVCSFCCPFVFPLEDGLFCVAGVALWQHEPILAWQAWDFSNLSSTSLRRRGVSATWPVRRIITGSSWIKMCRPGPSWPHMGPLRRLTWPCWILNVTKPYKNQCFQKRNDDKGIDLQYNSACWGVVFVHPSEGFVLLRLKTYYVLHIEFTIAHEN